MSDSKKRPPSYPSREELVTRAPAGEGAPDDFAATTLHRPALQRELDSRPEAPAARPAAPARAESGAQPRRRLLAAIALVVLALVVGGVVGATVALTLGAP